MKLGDEELRLMQNSSFLSYYGTSGSAGYMIPRLAGAGG